MYIHNTLRNALHGGVTSVYKPYGNNLFYSFYPAMALIDIPGDQCKYFINYNNVLYSIDDSHLGLFYCEIKTLLNISI